MQTPGGDISRLVESFPNLKVLRCDGTDFLDSYRTLGEAVGGCAASASRPSCTPRSSVPYSHSLSDDERLYKTPEEREAEARAIRSRACARSCSTRGLATEADLDAIAADVDREIAEATDAALGAEAQPIETADSFVFSPDVDPDVGGVRDAAQPKARPTRWWPPSTAR